MAELRQESIPGGGGSIPSPPPGAGDGEVC